MEMLDEIGDDSAPVGSRPWAMFYAQDAESKFRDARFTVSHIQSSLRSLKRAEVYKVMRDATGQPFVSWADFCDARRPFGLGIPHEMAEALLKETEVDRLVLDVKREVQDSRDGRTRAAASADDVGQVLPRGQPRKEMFDSDITSQSGRAKGNGVGRDTQIKLDKLAKHAPELLEQVKEGRMSAHAAALEAGVVKAPCPVRAAQRAVEKMDEDQLAAFREWFTEYAERNDT